jgi:AraC family transcriptional regulator of adaptative response/methylated-DNA-[protein]-cysteine methyltransferase
MPSIIERVCRYLEAHSEEKVTLEALSKVAGMSSFHLQRRFKREMGISPRQYLESYRFVRFKGRLRNGTVTQALVDSGYSSPSRVYETARKKLGMPPRQFGAGAPRERLRFTSFASELGEVLLVASDAGVCGVQFLEKEAGEARMRSEYPQAEFSRDDAGLRPWAVAVAELIRGQRPAPSIPLDIRGTAFQQLVWQQLQRIPAGQKRSYTEVARAIGKPEAVRAVAGACASNRLAVLIPCHRVVRGDGELSGYRWGAERKRRLLDAEAGGR